MEALFDLLEDGEEKEREVLKLRENGRLSNRGAIGGNDLLGPLTQYGGGPGESPAQVGTEEETSEQERKNARRKERPGDIASLILERMEETAGAEKKTGTLPEWAVGLEKAAAEERWYEAAQTRLNGAERLYLGINTPRLRGPEPGQRSAVVHLSEQGQSADAAAAMDVRALDRVFQRDARRYDGGLRTL